MISRRALFAVAAVMALPLATLAKAQTATPGRYKIGIIGSGNVGGTLGVLWAKAGDDVLFSSRHPEDLKDLAAKAGPHAKVGTPAEAAAFGDVVLIAVPYSAFPAIAKANGAAMKGKVVLDASNPQPQRDGAVAEQAIEQGVGAYATSLLLGTHYVRAFNAVGMRTVAARSGESGAREIGIPLASDDPEAIKVGSDLVRQAGFTPVVVPLGRAGEFGPGRPLGTGAYSVAEWKQKLGLAKGAAGD